MSTEQQGSATKTPILSVLGISKRFGGVQALQNVNFDLQAGEVLALAGGNGAGKSTLIKCISGVYQPDEGEIRCKGDAVEIPPSKLTRPVRTLSGGQRQVVAIGRAIYWQAEMLIMDEPTAALGVPEQR